MTAVGRALREVAMLVIHGAVGSGKTRLAKELARRADVIGSLQVAYVRCRPGDRGVAVRARAERSLDALPGSLAAVLQREPHLLIVDDVHHVPEDDAARLLAELCTELGEGRVLFLTRDVLPLRRDRRRFEMNLDGLDEASARELWSHHEETYGPTAADAADKALARTRGMPLALRREYARAAFNKDAWKLEKLPKDVRRALEAISVIRIPAAPAALAALAPKLKPEPALIDLVSKQLIDPLDDGRFSIHDVVRDEVLASIDPDTRITLERAAAELVSTVGRGRGDARRLAWDAGDDGALGLVDPVDRMREAVLHLIAAGDVDVAAARLIEDRAIATRRGGGGEMLALIETLESGDCKHAPALASLRAEIAARHGRVAQALEIAGDPLDPVICAELQFRSGDVETAVGALEALSEDADADTRCRAVAALVDIELCRGRSARAETLATEAFQRDRADISENVRASLHLALASVEENAGQITAARAALSRAASSNRLDAALAARIEGRRANCLAREGRVSEAEAALAEAEQSAREVDAVAVADEIRRCGAMVRGRRGSMLWATESLRHLVTLRRQRGDEIGALQVEIDLVDILLRRGELSAAAELGAASRSSAERRGLAGLEARAALAGAGIDVAELRLPSAAKELSRLADSDTADADVRARAASLFAQVDAWSGNSAEAPASRTETGDDIDAGCARAALALAAGESSAALEAARTVAVRAERAGRSAEIAESLAIVARLQLARGDKASAMAAATRAAREALGCGLSRARANALLVLAALARDSEDIPAAFAYAQDASQLAVSAGLPVERLVAAEAIDAIAGVDGKGSVGDASDVRNAAAATMTQPALDAAARVLADLGLTAVRPYRVVSATGQESFVADANPDLMQMADRELAVDGVREIILRDGEQTADLRRRSLLKRLLFLFAGSPGTIFSKEDIVETVWNVEYHPLRHDAALFTNIMRIRRLLGKDGADLIRVSEDGYRFVPPKDFIFVETVCEA